MGSLVYLNIGAINMDRYRIAIGKGFIEPSHRLLSFSDYKIAIQTFEAVVKHPRRTRYAELYFIQPDGTPDTLAWTHDK
jgi:hypothetical protein